MVDWIEDPTIMSADSLMSWLDKQARRNRQVRELDRAIARTSRLLAQAEGQIIGTTGDARESLIKRIDNLKTRLSLQTEHRSGTVQAEDRFLEALHM